MATACERVRATQMTTSFAVSKSRLIASSLCHPLVTEKKRTPPLGCPPLKTAQIFLRRRVCRTKLPPKNFDLDTKNCLKITRKKARNVSKNVKALSCCPEGPARHLDVSGQKLSPHCLETIFDSQLPSPKSSSKMPPKLSSPPQERAFFPLSKLPLR